MLQLFLGRQSLLPALPSPDEILLEKSGGNKSLYCCSFLRFPLVVHLVGLSPVPLKGLVLATQKFCAGPVALKYHVNQHCMSKGAT